jgi:acyl dehydratase
MDPTGAQRGWWLDDAVAGGTIVHPGGRTIGAAEHVWLAWLTFNASDIHGNADAAARGEWGQPLVLGALTAAIVIGLAEPATPPPELAAAGLAHGWHAITLERAVVAGDTIRAVSQVEAVEAVSGGEMGRVRRTISGLDQHHRVVARVREERLVARRPTRLSS